MKKQFIRIISNLSIRQKIIVLSMLTTIMGLLALTLAYINYDYHSTKKNIIREIELVSLILANRLDSSVAFQQQDTAKNDLLDLAAKKTVIRGCLYDTDMNLFASYTQNESFTCENILEEDEFPKIKGNFLFILQKTQSGAALLVVSNLNELHTRIKDYLLFSIAVFIAIVILVLSIISYLQKIITEPILELTQASKEIIQSKDYSKHIRKYYDDETGKLVDIFNQLLAKVHKQQNTLEEEVTERTIDLENALKVKKRLISNMSHEIRTPMHHLQAFSGYLTKALSNASDQVTKWKEENSGDSRIDTFNEYLAEFNKYAEKTNLASQRYSRVMNNILEVGQLANNDILFHVVQADLVPPVEDTICFYKKKYSGEIIFTPPKKTMFCLLDKKQILKVLDNLFANAVTYAKNSPQLMIHIGKTRFKDPNGKSRTGVKFSMIDEGVGIPPDELEVIFELFGESSSTRNDAGGRGIGLTVCREIITQHNGLIWAESNPRKQGAIFHFVLPVT